MFDVKSASLDGVKKNLNPISLHRSDEIPLALNASYARNDLSLPACAPPEAWRDPSSKYNPPLIERNDRVKENPSRQVAKDEPMLLWGVMAGFFLALVFAYPLVMIWMDDPHGLRYVIRLGATLGIVTAMIAVGAVFTWSRDGAVRPRG